jgi:putative transposase
MPWRETSPMEERVEFVRECQSGLFTMTELAEQYGISRVTGYKWLERYAAEGVAGLADRSRRPHRSPQATEAELIEALLTQRRRHPRWGAKKLLAVVRQRDADAAWPARSTVCAVLKRHGLVLPQRRPRRPPHGAHVLTAMTRPNEVWTTDFKGEFRTGDHRYCYPLTLRDGFSRYVLRCDALLSRCYELTRRRFERAFAEYGLPDRIRSDNGEPFASSGLGRLTRLNVWWMQLGIVPERIALGHPEQNGSHEQFHRVLKAETTRPPAPHAAAQQRRFRAFCREYNEDRPHESLADRAPASLYHPSPRPLPARVPGVAYAGHFEIRRVSTSGTVSWKKPLFLSEVLGGHDVGFEAVGDGVWTLYFGSVILGRFDERQHRIHPIATISAGRSASSAGSAPEQENTNLISKSSITC